MLLSIVTPVFNGERYIKETMDSIHHQSFKNFEHIVVDGGSTDGTLNIVKQYPNVILVTGKDKGQSDALNKGFKLAKGDILAWQNSDDCYFSDTFEKVIKLFGSKPNVDVIYGSYQVIDSDSNWVCDVYSKNWNLFNFSHGLFVPMQPTVFWRKSVYQKIGDLNIDLKFCMDVDFFAKASKNFIFHATKDFLGKFRVHNESKTHSPNVLKIVMKEKRKVLSFNYNYGLMDEFLFLIFSLRSIIGGKIKPYFFKKL